MASTKCIRCSNETFQKESICVLCKTDITQMYEELIQLLKKNKEWRLLKTAMTAEANNFIDQRRYSHHDLLCPAAEYGLIQSRYEK